MVNDYVRYIVSVNTSGFENTIVLSILKQSLLALSHTAILSNATFALLIKLGKLASYINMFVSSAKSFILSLGSTLVISLMNNKKRYYAMMMREKLFSCP